MFFNLGPFSFGMQEPPQPPRRPNQHPNRNNQGGFFGGIGDFLQDQFMNPFFQPNNHQRQRPQQEEPRPAFHRATGSKKQSEKKQNNKQKKEKEQEKQKVVYTQNTGMYWKQKANQQFKKGRNQTALEYYTKAISLNNTQSVFFSNRARCLKKMGKLEEALRDAQQSVELDSENIKGNLLCGQILCETGKRSKDIRKVSNAINRLTKSLTLCVGQNKDTEFQNEIGNYIYRAKKLQWYLKFQEIKVRRIQAINNYKNYLQKDQNINKETAQNRLKQFIQATNQSIVFQIPDHLTCKITFDLMEDPVVTDSGQVYERSAIQEHMERNGKTDPFTRKPISGNLYPCIAIKKAVQDFLEKNPWAYQYSQGQNFMDISF